MKKTNGTLAVRVFRAKGLKSPPLCGKVDPYVLAEYNDQEKKSTIGHPGSAAPRPFPCFCLGKGTTHKWDETLKFHVKCPVSKDDKHKLVIKIIDKDVFSDDDFLGQATIYLKEVIEIGLEQGRAEIHPQKYRIVSSDQSYCGEILLGVTFTAKMVTEEIKHEGAHRENMEIA